jgi:hypothetical protein
MRRRAGAPFVLLLLGLLPAACGVWSRSPAQQYEPLHYEYLTKLRLDVAGIDIDDSWAPRGDARHVEFMAPISPVDALRQMAMDRLVAGGTTKRALYSIEDASIIKLPDRYQANLAVRLEVLDDHDNRQRGIEARVTDVHPISGDSDAVVRKDLYALTRQAMDNMNVEFEYQIRHHLNVELQPTTPTAPPPPPVSTEDLGTPGGKPPSAQPPSGPEPATLAPTPLAPPDQMPPPAVQPPSSD